MTVGPLNLSTTTTKDGQMLLCEDCQYVAEDDELTEDEWTLVSADECMAMLDCVPISSFSQQYERFPEPGTAYC